MSTIPVRKRGPRSEAQIDETIDESFPASDPPSYSRTARAGSPPRGKKITRVAGEEDANSQTDETESKDSKE